MTDLNIFLHGFAAAQVMIMSLAAFKSKGKGIAKKCLGFGAILVLMFVLKPLFLRYQLTSLYFIGVFLSGLLPFTVYLFSSALFNDHFVLSHRHKVGFFFSFVMSIALFLYIFNKPYVTSYYWIFECFFLIFLGLAIKSAFHNWRDDLVNSRIRFRKFFLFFLLSYSVLVALRVLNENHLLFGSTQSFANAFMLSILSFWFNLNFIYANTILFDSSIKKEEIQLLEKDESLTIKARLNPIMKKDKFYLTEKISVQLLAEKLDLPEYKLRYYINSELGHRNFQDYINQKRIDYAKSLLKDPLRRKDKILSIALSSGFRSLASFNRVFKQHTGLSPSGFKEKTK